MELYPTHVAYFLKQSVHIQSTGDICLSRSDRVVPLQRKSASLLLFLLLYYSSRLW